MRKIDKLKIGDIVETTYGDSKCVVTDIENETFGVTVIASQYRWKVGYTFRYKSRDRWKFSNNITKPRQRFLVNDEIS